MPSPRSSSDKGRDSHIPEKLFRKLHPISIGGIPPLNPKDGQRLMRLLLALVAVTLAGCAVGPDFRRPDPPAVASYAAEALPSETAEAKVPGGEPQRFVPGEEIPPRWWALFR